MSKLSGEDAKRLWFAELLNKNGVDTGIDVDEVFEKLTGENMKSDLIEECDNKCCANISLKRIYLILLKAQEMILENNHDKQEIVRYLSSIEHEILLLNDKENSISRDLFQ